MKRCISLSVLVTLFVWTGAALAQDAITIKIKKSAEGDSIEVERTESAKIEQKAFDAKGAELVSKAATTTRNEVYKEAIFKLGEDKKPIKLERTYSKAEEKSDGMATALPYQGKTVVIEKKGDKFTFMVKGGEELKGKDAQSLEHEFNDRAGEEDLDKLILPKGAVKVNDEWQIDMKPLAKQFGASVTMELDGDKSTGTAKLLKVYQKDGKQFGEIQLKMEMPIKAMGKGDSSVKADDGSKVLFEGVLDGCIDGSSSAGSMTSKVKLSASAPVAQAPVASVSVTVTADSVQVEKELPKK